MEGRTLILHRLCGSGVGSGIRARSSAVHRVVNANGNLRELTHAVERREDSRYLIVDSGFQATPECADRNGFADVQVGA